MNGTPHIIEDPAKTTVLRRLVEGGVTTVAWIIWFYMVLPLLTLGMWAIGIRLVFVEQLKLSGIHGLASVLGYYAAGVAVIGLLLALWHIYNRRRFAGRDRRHEAEPVTDDEIRALFRVSGSDPVSARDARFVDVAFGDDGITLEIRDHA